MAIVCYEKEVDALFPFLSLRVPIKGDEYLLINYYRDYLLLFAGGVFQMMQYMLVIWKKA